MGFGEKISKFILPELNRRYLIRVGIVALAAYVFFGHICIPMHINGKSMEPTYHDGSFTFCWRLRYLFSRPGRGDVVIVRYAGTSVMLLKRVVALEGETVGFKGGKLIVNGEEIEEPYVKFPCAWDLEPRKVGEGCVYVVGDNRDVLMEGHDFGQAKLRRIAGAPVW